MQIICDRWSHALSQELCERYQQRVALEKRNFPALLGSLWTVSSDAERGRDQYLARTYVTRDSDHIGQIYLGEKELKVRRIGYNAMMEQDAVHIGYEADVTLHLLDTNGKKIVVTGFLQTGAVVSVMPIKTWERMGFTREDLIPTNLRLAAANRGAIYIAGRKTITVLHMGGRDLWMSFLVVENLDNFNQFILVRDFVRNFDVMIDFNNGLIKLRNPERRFFKKPNNRTITDENKAAIFLTGCVSNF